MYIPPRHEPTDRPPTPLAEFVLGTPEFTNALMVHNRLLADHAAAIARMLLNSPPATNPQNCAPPLVG